MSRVRVFACALAVAFSAIPAFTSAAVPRGPFNDVEILPQEIKLDGPAARQSLIVQRVTYSDTLGSNMKYFGQIPTGDVRYTSSHEHIVRIENGVAIPVADGTARIEAYPVKGMGGATATVTVTGMQKPFQWSFRNHVESVMLKTGCTTGPCHGAQAGKGGFKLSLRGYDPEGDYTTLTRQARGRRITPTDPGRSLILTKPTGAVPHKGGLRFRVDSLEYKVISEWIAAGTPAPKPDDARIERIEILPQNVTLKKAAEQQLIVLAHFTDGRTEDVTRWTLFTSANESAVQIDQSGLAKTVGYGEGAVTA
ncbi:MAG: Ig-like domain-containing protein, partial [Planctomycetales bacterium]|nr:Ig-like domain-containing protein [Planctomycetales bacterium]